jgi:hypothetical protein
VTPDGRKYPTVVDVNVPATTGSGEQREDGKLTVAVAAEVNGAGGNLGSGNIDRIEGPLMFSLAVEQLGAIAGGTDRESIYVTETDRQNLRDGLLNDLVARADADLKAGVEPGEITADGKFSLDTVECLGSCGTAPMLQLGSRFVENLSVKTTLELIDGLEN